MANCKLKEEKVKEMALGLMNGIALFPSIDQRKAAKFVAEDIIASEVEYCEIEVLMAGIYLATI